MHESNRLNYVVRLCNERRSSARTKRMAATIEVDKRRRLQSNTALIYYSNRVKEKWCIAYWNNLLVYLHDYMDVGRGKKEQKLMKIFLSFFPCEMELMLSRDIFEFHQMNLVFFLDCVGCCHAIEHGDRENKTWCETKRMASQPKPHTTATAIHIQSRVFTTCNKVVAGLQHLQKNIFSMHQFLCYRHDGQRST